MSSQNDWLVIVPFLCPLAARILSSGYDFSDEWYGAVPKPPFGPPRWVFGPVWTALYVGLGVALRAAVESNSTLTVALVSTLLVMNALWTPIFLRGYFGEAAVLLGAMVIESFVTALAFMRNDSEIETLPIVCLLVYTAWLTYAFRINYFIYENTRENYREFRR